MALISKPLVLFNWIIRHQKAIMLLFSNIMSLNTFRVTFLLMSAVFNDIRKKTSCGIIQSFLKSHSYTFKKKRKWTGPGSFLCWLDYFSVSYVPQRKKNSFWTIIKKICLRQQEKNASDVIAFSYFERTTQ